ARPRQRWLILVSLGLTPRSVSRVPFKLDIVSAHRVKRLHENAPGGTLTPAHPFVSRFEHNDRAGDHYLYKSGCFPRRDSARILSGNVQLAAAVHAVGFSAKLLQQWLHLQRHCADSGLLQYWAERRYMAVHLPRIRSYYF